MKTVFPSLFFAITFLFSSSAFAEEKARQPEPAPAAESDAAKQWKELQAQEQWVARLQKQIAGEIKQLSEMRAKLAQDLKLDPKKLENGDYQYDSKSDQFIDKKPQAQKA